ncbi:MAG TPA: hypothetical protein VKU39_11465 [Streptosporangiaceae bacterium]|nr:hypothetical protein [Streptosporangiaceae bacterium]
MSQPAGQDPARLSLTLVDVFFKAANGSRWHVFRVSGGSWAGPASLGGDLYPGS